MTDRTAQGLTSEQRIVLNTFSRTLGREMHVLTQNPELLWQQLFNRLQWEGEPIPAVLRPEFLRRTAQGVSPWLRNRIPYEESAALVRTLEGHAFGVDACAYSPDGRRIVTANGNKTLKIWDAETGDELHTLEGHTDWIEDCAYSPDGRRVISADQKTLKVWDAETGQEVCTLNGHRVCEFHPDGSQIASSSSRDMFKIWDSETGEEVLTFKGSILWIHDCAFSPDGRRIVSANYKNNTLKIWDAETGDELGTFEGHTDRVEACAFSPDGLRVISASWDKTLKIWDPETGEEVRTLKGHANWVKDCAYSPDGLRVVSASDDKTIKLWDAETGDELGTFEGHTDRVRACAFSPDGTRIISGSADGTLKIWDPSMGEDLEKRQPTIAAPTGRYREGMLDSTMQPWVETAPGSHAEVVTACEYSSNGSRIVSASNDTSLKVWNAETGQEIYTLKGHKQEVTACAISPDGDRVASVTGNSVKLWDIETGEEIRIPDKGIFSVSFWVGWLSFILVALFITQIFLPVETMSPVRSAVGCLVAPSLLLFFTKIAFFAADRTCAYSPDGRRLVSSGIGFGWNPLRIRNAQTGERLYTQTDRGLFRLYSFIFGCAYSPDGTRVVTANEDKTLKMWFADILGKKSASPHMLKLWDPETGEEIGTLEGHTDRVRACAFSPDSRRLVSASYDKTLKIWNPETGEAIHTLKGHTSRVNDCAYSPDGCHVVSASRDKTLKVWDAETGGCVGTLPLSGDATAVAHHPFQPNLAIGDEVGSIYLIDRVGVVMGPVVVTAVDLEDGPEIRCPVCFERYRLQEAWLGQEIECPGSACQARWQVNPFIAGRSTTSGLIKKVKVALNQPGLFWASITGFYWYMKGSLPMSILVFTMIMHISRQSIPAISALYLASCTAVAYLTYQWWSRMGLAVALGLVFGWILSDVIRALFLHKHTGSKVG